MKMIGKTPNRCPCGWRHCTDNSAPKHYTKERRTAKRRERQSWKREI